MTGKAVQIAPSKSTALAAGEIHDDLREWFQIYFATQVTTSPRSQKEQVRDLSLFLTFLRQEFGNTLRTTWSPRASRDFLFALQNTIKEDGTKKWSDRTVNRMTAHLKTFAKWIHQHRPFPLGQPMAKITMLSVGNQLEIERALTKQERNRILDAADRHRHGGPSRRRGRVFVPIAIGPSSTP